MRRLIPQIDMNLRVRQIIKINKISVCYNGKGDDGEDGFVHFFTLNVPGKETTFTVPEISVSVLSRVLDKVMDRYSEFGKEVSKQRRTRGYTFG